MEVVDSHMSEQFSAHTPAHIDVDMSAEYDDDAEYAMHDVTEATTTTNDTNDEEIYDAEFEEVPQHTEIEMDEYADEVEAAEEDETHMGTYVPTDDAATVTDVTVEDVQLRSSPVPQGTTIGSISPHVSVDAELPLSEAPVGALADHSPHSVTTLVGDSEIEHLPADTTKEDHLNEVIDLTENDEGPRIAPVEGVEEAPSVDLADPTDQALPQSDHDVTQDEPDEAEQEFYDTEEPVAELPSTDPTVPDQPTQQQEDGQQDEEGHRGYTDQDERPTEAPVYLEIPERTDHDGHSPIEKALVINQQVRDDAADSMEPSPPVRLCYRDESKGVDEVFDIFTSTGLESHETPLLFHDNRTLFYDPLSVFFAKLRETEYFSGDEWENAEMGLRMDLGDSTISISEDHKETENISLFKLSFIWSGLGLEEPLELTLIRLSERFVVQLARLVEQVEQRDFHNEDASQPLQARPGAETGGSEINSGTNDNSEPVALENNNQESEARALIIPRGTPGDSPRGTHESVDPQPRAVRLEEVNGQRQEVNGDDEIETPQEIGADRNLEETAEDIPTYNQDPILQPENIDHQGTEVEDTGPSSQDDDAHTASNGQSPSTPTIKPQEDEYDEYEVEEANDSTPAQTSTQKEASTAGWDTHEYDYEEDYDGVNEEHGERTLPDNTPNEPTGSDRASTPSASQPQGQEPFHNAGLKRNLDELEYEEYETPSAPSSPGSEYKRVKHT